MRKILYISLRADVGGGPQHLYQLIKLIKRDEFQVYLACPPDEPYYSLFSSELENKIILLPHRSFSIRTFFEIVRFCKKNNIDIIHSHGKGAGLYSRLIKFFIKKVKVYHTFHGIHYQSYGLLKRKIYFLIEKLFSLVTCVSIFVSPGEKSEAQSLNLLAKGSYSCVVENGVFIPNQRKIIAIEDDLVKIVVVSRFDYQKNTQRLLDIIEYLIKNSNSNFHFDILGEGEDKNFLQSSIPQKNNLTVDFHGNIPNPDFFYRNAHFILNTSRWEGLPLSVIEAASYGCVPILSNVVGNIDIISRNPKMGLLYNEYNEILEFIKCCITDETIFEERRRNAYECVNLYFNEQRMSEKTYALYNK
ncbi:glycosyltransferase [Gallaecimonas mangrovi]|uniref:glycosyltransferase n=1 Tax=Gallaecimonas mangrovi TaxID=2291597 RepID=UPI000E20894F|nr:glycosyltransferase [Gallaecimonas mangrovi]